jgi:hypothetical protein
MASPSCCGWRSLYGIQKNWIHYISFVETRQNWLLFGPFQLPGQQSALGHDKTVVEDASFNLHHL